MEEKGELERGGLFKCCGESSSNVKGYFAKFGQAFPRHPLATGIGELLSTSTAYDSASCTYVFVHARIIRRRNADFPCDIGIANHLKKEIHTTHMYASGEQVHFPPMYITQLLWN